MNLTASATPAEVDTLLLAAINTQAEAQRNLDRACKTIEYIEGIVEGERKYYSWCSPEALTAARAEVRANADSIMSAQHEIDDLNSEFVSRGGWARYYLVLNSNGHVHSSQNCSSCFPTTQYAWLTEQSGMTPQALVELAGESACTDCFPWAPVNTLRRHSVLEAPERKAARLVREAEKAAREQTKIAKALTTDGSPFIVHFGPSRWDKESFKTEQAASQWVVGALADNKMYGYSLEDGKQAAIGQIIAAMADKHDTSIDEIMAVIVSKVAAKIKRDSRY